MGWVCASSWKALEPTTVPFPQSSARTASLGLWVSPPSLPEPGLPTPSCCLWGWTDEVPIAQGCSCRLGQIILPLPKLQRSLHQVHLLQTQFRCGTYNCISLYQWSSKCGFWQHQHHLLKCKFSAPLQAAELGALGVVPAVCVLTNPLGGSDALSSLT